MRDCWSWIWQKNREMFEPFIEDEVPFDEYCQSMEKDGTWAGHMELQAASLVTHSNICIHRVNFLFHLMLIHFMWTLQKTYTWFCNWKYAFYGTYSLILSMSYLHLFCSMSILAGTYRILTIINREWSICKCKCSLYPIFCHWESFCWNSIWYTINIFL